MVAEKEIAPDLLAEAKRLHKQALAPVDDIAGIIGLSRTNFYKRVRDGGWRGRRAKVAPFQFARALSGGGGRVKQAGVYPALGDEMCDFGLDGLSSGRAPDRLDALMWAVTALTFGTKGQPGVRGASTRDIRLLH